MADCFTCEVNAGRISAPGGTIYQDEHWLADHGVDRLVRGYVVLKPKRHVHEMADLLPEEAMTFGHAAQTLLSAMRSALGTERIYVCSFAETVHHLHFHLLPRYPESRLLAQILSPICSSSDGDARFRKPKKRPTKSERRSQAAPLRIEPLPRRKWAPDPGVARGAPNRACLRIGFPAGLVNAPRRATNRSIAPGGLDRTTWILPYSTRLPGWWEIWT